MSGPGIKLGVTFYYVGNLNKAKEIYSRFLGTEPFYADEDWVRFQLEGGALALHHLPDLAETQDISQVKYGAVASFTVTDIEKTLAQAKEAGFRQVREVDVQPFGKLSAIQDPWGNRISLLEPTDKE